MKTIKEISDQIALMNKAIEKDGFKPVVDGTHLQEHLYYIRRGAIDHLTWVIESEAEKEEQEARALAEMEDELNRLEKMDEIENDLAQQEKDTWENRDQYGVPW